MQILREVNLPEVSLSKITVGHEYEIHFGLLRLVSRPPTDSFD